MPSPTPANPIARYTPPVTPGRRAFAVLAASAAVAAVAFATSLLALFVANGQSPEVFLRATGHFLLVAVFTWALLSVANAVGAARSWFLGVLSGFASAVLAALVATSLAVLGSERSDSPEVFLFVLGSL